MICNLCNLWGEEYDLICDRPARQPSFSAVIPAGQSFFQSSVELSRQQSFDAERETVESYSNYGSKSYSVSVIKKHKGITRQCSFRTRKPSKGFFLEVPSPPPPSSSPFRSQEWHPGPNSFRCRTPSRSSLSGEESLDDSRRTSLLDCLEDVSDSLRLRNERQRKVPIGSNPRKKSWTSSEPCFRRQSSCILVPSTVQEVDDKDFRLVKVDKVFSPKTSLKESPEAFVGSRIVPDKTSSSRDSLAGRGAPKTSGSHRRGSQKKSKSRKLVCFLCLKPIRSSSERLKIKSSWKMAFRKIREKMKDGEMQDVSRSLFLKNDSCAEKK